MRTLSFLLLLSLIQISVGQDDAYHTALRSQLQADHGLTGGSWLLTGNEQTNFSDGTIYGVTSSETYAPSGQDFGTAMRISIPGTGSNPWDAGYFNGNTSSLQNGDKVLLCVWLRARPGVSTNATLSIFAEETATFEKRIYLTTQLDTVWRQYLLPFESNKAYAPGELRIGYHLSYGSQDLEVAGLNCLNFGQSVSLDDLPTQIYVFYEGSAPDAPWRALAKARIEQHRKSDMTLTLTDPSGSPISNADVRVVMTRHEFGFGSALNPRRLVGNAWNNPTYQSKITNLDGQGHGFNVGVTENALKWDAWEEGWAGSPAEIVNGLQWLTNNGVTMRGHVLVWPGWIYLPTDMQANAGNPSFLQNRINGHLGAILNTPGVRANVREWDVVNEISHVRDLENALAGQPGFTTGREIYADILQQVALEDSGIVTYLNDYEILSNGSVNGSAYTLFKSMIQEVIASGASLDGIGFQGHMGTNLVAPDSLYAILEDCYQEFGKAIKITEYDLDGVLPDDLEAQYLHDFLTLVFSHPAMEAFIMWGFWDGAHWKENAPLFYEDWSPKPALATFNDLVFDQWWTDSLLTTDASGKVDLRGFKGEYRVYVSLNGVGYEEPFTLTNTLDTTIQILSLSSIDDFRSSRIKVFPNPFTQDLTIVLPHEGKWQIELMDIRGRSLVERETTSSKLDLAFPDLIPGVYLLQATNGNGQRFYQKVIKE